MMPHTTVLPPAWFTGRDPVPPGGRARADGAEPAAMPEKRIAIVEDELMVAWSLESTLEELGYGVAGIFANPNAALASLLTSPADLVLMDINLGDGLDGIDTARQLRSAYAVPIIFISAYADRATRQRIENTVPGAFFLPKPVRTSDLKAAIERAFDVAH